MRLLSAFGIFGSAAAVAFAIAWSIGWFTG